MKKGITFIMALAMLLSFTTLASAYTTDEYSVEVPDSYTETSKGTFQNENGDSFTIGITPMNDPSKNIYTQERLDSFVDSLENKMDKYKAAAKEKLIEQYAGTKSEEEINAYVDSFQIESISTKEITTCTPNEYKCYHIIVRYDSYATEMYSIVSGDKAFHLSFSAADESYFTSQEKEDILNSFTINNYSAPKPATIWERFLSKGIVYIAIVVLSGVGVVIGVAKRKKKQKLTETPISNCSC